MPTRNCIARYEAGVIQQVDGSIVGSMRRLLAIMKTSCVLGIASAIISDYDQRNRGLGLWRRLSHVKEYVGDDLRIGALGRCQCNLTGTLDDYAVVSKAAHDGVRVGILRIDPLLNHGRPRLLEPPIGVVDLPAVVVFDDVMLGSGGWGCSRRVLYTEHRRKTHCGENHPSDGYG
jgi:hypothetical protein